MLNIEPPNDFKENNLKRNAFKYWDVFLSWLFKYPSRCYSLKSKEHRSPFINKSKALFQFAQTYRLQSASKGIICNFTKNLADIEKTGDMLELALKATSNPLHCDLVTAEILAKVLAYRDLKKGMRIKVPTLNANQTLDLVPYEVDHVFNLWNKVRAFGLINVKKGCGAPILLFRGTDFSFLSKGGRASIISDLDPKGPGRSLYEKAKPNLIKWLQGVKKRKGKARLIGHSLGGVILAYTLIHNNELISTRPHQISYAFNFPGISLDLSEKWQCVVESKRPTFKGFICRGDVVSKFGLLFGNVYEVSYKTPLSPIFAHEQLLFSQPSAFIHLVDIDEENGCSARDFYSKLQHHGSALIYEFGLKFLFPR